MKSPDYSEDFGAAEKPDSEPLADSAIPPELNGTLESTQAVIQGILSLATPIVEATKVSAPGQALERLLASVPTEMKHEVIFLLAAFACSCFIKDAVEKAPLKKPPGKTFATSIVSMVVLEALNSLRGKYGI